MRTLGTLAAILLLLPCTTKSATINGVIRPRTISNDDIQKRTPEILVAHSSAKINNDLSSLTDSENVVSKQNNARTSLDQQVDQSEIMLIRDLENMEEALSIMEYEPQKINRKGKRKISGSHKNAEIEYSSETKEPAPTVISNTYQDPPAPKKNPTLPKYYLNPSQESPLQYSDPRSKPAEPEPPGPLNPLPRSPKPRKVRPLTPHIPEETNPPPSDPKGHKHVEVSSPHFTKSIRKKKIRKRLREKINPENYNGTSDRPQSPKRPGELSSVTAQSSLKKLISNENGPVVAASIDRNQGRDKKEGKVVDRSSKLYEKNVKGPMDPVVNNEGSPKNYYDVEDRAVDKESAQVGEGVETPSSLEAYGKDRDVYSRTQSSRTPSSFDGYGSGISYEGSTYQKGGSRSENEEEPTTSSLNHGIRGSKAGTSATSSLEARDLDDYQNSRTPSSFDGYTTGSPYKGSTYQKGGSRFENDESEPTTSSLTQGLRGSKAGTSATPSLEVRDSAVYQNSRTPSSFNGYGTGLPYKGSTYQKGGSSFENEESESTTLSSTHDIRGSKATSTPSSLDAYDNVRDVYPTAIRSSKASISSTPSLEAYGNVRDDYQNSRTSSFDNYGTGLPHKTSSYQKSESRYESEEEPTTLSSTGPRGTKTVRTPNFGYSNDKSYRQHEGYVIEPVTEYYEHVTSLTSSQKPERISPASYPNPSYEDIEESTQSPHTVRPPIEPTSSYYASTYNNADSSSSLDRLDTWAPRTKLKRLKEAEDRSDVVAEATNLGDKEESKNRRVYEDSGERDYQRNEGNGEDKRYGEKYEDAQAEGTHDEKHEGKGGGGGGKGGEGGKGGGGGGGGKFEEGEGAKHEEGHHETEDEKGEKGYESWHKEEKANKGHHDKEQHSNHYEEEDAKKKEHKEDGEYHEEHQKGEHGEKDAKFDEKGEHDKGHNTKGEHFVHKKDEFEKRTEFFDEYHEDDDSEKDGEFHHEHESSKGGHEKKGHLDKGEHEEHYGKKGQHEKGEHYHKEDGHKQAEGKDDHYEHEDMHGQKKEQDEEKKWAYKKGDDGGKGDGGKDHKSDR